MTPLAVNQQPVEKVVNRENGDLEVVKIWETIQGEGPSAGTPAVFVRTAGCVTQCGMCDTDYTSGRALQPVSEIVDWVRSLRKSGLVVLTGGEPFRQNVSPFVRAMVDAGDYTVQIETNGMCPPLSPLPMYGVEVVCSPKGPNVHDELKPKVNALKYVLTAGMTDEEDGLPISVLGNGVRVARPWPTYTGPVYVQPADQADPVLNEANIKETVRVAMKYGYIVGLQLHKYIGVE